MDRLCDEFLTGPALAFDQNGRVALRDLCDRRLNLPNFRRTADHIRSSYLAAKLTLQKPVLVEKLTVAMCVRYGFYKIFVDEGLGDVVVRALSQSGDRRIYGRKCCHDNYECGVVDRFDLIEQLDAVDAGHLDIGEGGREPRFS